MKKLVLVLAALLAMASLTGCLRMHNEVVIEDDGSGSMSFEMGVTQSVADALKELAELDPDGQGQDIPALDEINQDDIKKAIAPYDVKLTRFERSEVEGRENIIMAFEFKDLKGMSAAMTAAMGSGGEDLGQGLGIFDAGDGNLVLKSTEYDFSDMPRPEKDETVETETTTPSAQDPEVMQKQMEIMGKLMQSMSELDVRMTIAVPGDIVETNAPEQDGRTSIWVVNGENMMTAGQNMEPVITFSGKGLKIKALTE